MAVKRRSSSTYRIAHFGDIHLESKDEEFAWTLRAIEDAGVPKGVANMVIGSASETSDEFMQNPAVRKAMEQENLIDWFKAMPWKPGRTWVGLGSGQLSTTSSTPIDPRSPSSARRCSGPPRRSSSW